MNEVLVKLKALPSKLLDILTKFIDGIANQVSTSKGAVTLLIIIVVVADILLKGSVGVIGFTVDQAKIILTAIANVLKAGGWQLIIIALILVMLKKNK